MVCPLLICFFLDSHPLTAGLIIIPFFSVHPEVPVTPVGSHRQPPPATRRQDRLGRSGSRYFRTHLRAINSKRMCIL